MSILEAVVQAAPFIHQLNPYAQLVVTDCEKYIFALPGEDFYLDVFSAGKKFLDGSIGKEVATTGKWVSRMGNKQLTGGIPYQGTGVPIFENNQVVGGMCIFYPTVNRESLKETSETMVGMVQELTATLESFQEANQFLHHTATSLSEEGTTIQGYTASIESMAKLIAEVSSQTQLLGLNAAIEAAHAGDAGRGFSVVAAEIRKLSQHASSSVNQISNTLKELTKAIGSIDQNIKALSLKVDQETEVVSSLSESVKQVQQVGDQLHQLSLVMKI